MTILELIKTNDTKNWDYSWHPVSKLSEIDSD
jgi:hypothetical protein